MLHWNCAKKVLGYKKKSKAIKIHTNYKENENTYTLHGYRYTIPMYQMWKRALLWRSFLHAPRPKLYQGRLSNDLRAAIYSTMQQSCMCTIFQYIHFTHNNHILHHFWVIFKFQTNFVQLRCSSTYQLLNGSHPDRNFSARVPNSRRSHRRLNVSHKLMIVVCSAGVVFNF